MVKRYYMAGVWDLFHIGHLNAIKTARAIAGKDHLTIGVVTDAGAYMYKGQFPIISYEQRFAIISALQYPDAVVEEGVQFNVEHLRRLSITHVLLGKHWQASMPEHLVRLMEDIHVSFVPCTDNVSTTLLRKKISNGET